MLSKDYDADVWRLVKTLLDSYGVEAATQAAAQVAAAKPPRSSEQCREVVDKLSSVLEALLELMRAPGPGERIN